MLVKMLKNRCQYDANYISNLMHPFSRLYILANQGQVIFALIYKNFSLIIKTIIIIIHEKNKGKRNRKKGFIYVIRTPVNLPKIVALAYTASILETLSLKNVCQPSCFERPNKYSGHFNG